MGDEPLTKGRCQACRPTSLMRAKTMELQGYVIYRYATPLYTVYTPSGVVVVSQQRGQKVAIDCGCAIGELRSILYFVPVAMLTNHLLQHHTT